MGRIFSISLYMYVSAENKSLRSCLHIMSRVTEQPSPYYAPAAFLFSSSDPQITTQLIPHIQLSLYFTLAVHRKLSPSPSHPLPTRIFFPFSPLTTSFLCPTASTALPRKISPLTIQLNLNLYPLTLLYHQIRLCSGWQRIPLLSIYLLFLFTASRSS